MSIAAQHATISSPSAIDVLVAILQGVLNRLGNFVGFGLPRSETNSWNFTTVVELDSGHFLLDVTVEGEVFGLILVFSRNLKESGATGVRRSVVGLTCRYEVFIPWNGVARRASKIYHVTTRLRRFNRVALIQHGITNKQLIKVYPCT